MGPPERVWHRIILFFLYSSSLLYSEPTHVFGRTRWLTLANGNQKTRVKVTWLLYSSSLEVFHPAWDKFFFLLWRLYRVWRKTLIQPSLSEVRLQFKQQHLLNGKVYTQDYGREASAFMKAM